MNRVIAGSLLILLLIVLFATGVYFYQQYSIIFENPLKAVPADAAFIVEAKHPAQSLKSFFQSDVQKEIPEGSWFAAAANDFHFLDSLISDNGKAAEIWTSRSLVISAHLVRADRYGFLYLTNLPRGWSERKLRNFISLVAGSNSFAQHEYLNVNIYEMTLNDSMTMTFASDRSVAMFSFTPMLVEQAIRQFKAENAVTDSKVFRKISLPDYKKGEVIIYVSYPALRDFASSLSSGSTPLFYSVAGSFAHWSGLTATTDNSGLTLKGKTSYLDSTDLISLLRFQQPQVLHASSIAPIRTSMLVQFGLSNARDFMNRMNRQPLYAVDDREKIIATMEKSSRFHTEEHFTSWLGNEIALIVTEPAGNFIDNNLYACIRTTNPAEALNQLSAMKAIAEKKSGIIRKEEKYHNCIITSIPLKGIVPLMYGKMFSGISNCYYTSISDYIVFANQSSSLKDLIDEYDEGKVLDKELGYHSTHGNFSTSCNVGFYMSPLHAVNITGASSGNSFINLLSQSSGIHAQWTNSGPDITTQIYLDFRKKEMKEPALLFSVQLDTTTASTPAIVTDETHQPFIFVQDENKNLYKIDFSGNIVWKKEWLGKIHSGISVVDYYHDGRSQLLFNTETQLYLVDLNGESVGNYPIRLPANSSNACSVANRNIYIACTNHVIYAYQLNGKPLGDWNYFKTNAIVTKPIQSFNVDNVNYLTISEEHDAVTFTDSKGNQKISYRDKFVQADNSNIFFYGKDSLTGYHFISTDTASRIIHLLPDHNGEIKYSSPSKKFSSQHVFIVADADGDGKQDEVFLDHNEFTAFREDGSILFENKFSDSLSANLYKYNFDGEEKLFLTSGSSNKIYMLDRTGSVSKGFPLKGYFYPAFATANMRKILVVGSNDSNLQVYELK